MGKMGEAKIMIDGRTLTLKYDFNAIAELERLQGMSVASMFAGDIANNFGIRAIRDAIYCGLIWSNPALTVKQVGEQLRFEEIEHYAKAVSEGLVGALGDPKKVQTGSSEESEKDLTTMNSSSELPKLELPQENSGV